ncbi:MAG: hypothetical protein Q8M25_06285 [Rhodoferax sp.]|nr:hypothetical protein [Rhodoferax sp.]
MRPLYLIALGAGGFAAAAFWLQQSAVSEVPAAGLFLTWLACLGAAVGAAGRDHAGALKWSAGQWTWDSRGILRGGDLTVLVDLQQVVVVVARCDDGRAFGFCLHRNTDPVLWPALRRALVSTSGHHANPVDSANAGAPP